MKREEAIKLLSVLWERHAHIDKYDVDKKYMWTDGDYVEALEMAIKALQEPYEGTISIQTVLDMLEDINAETDGVGFYYEHYVDYIKGMPSVKPQEPKTDVLDKIRLELHATAEMHEDGDYYIRDEWIDEYFDKYKVESEG